ncbi:MAG: CYTH domain-containing protein [Chloroflexi bacterium]|uniref:CYTH domain-containing protein n=1 Tax=Candidatus Chlorohelix allophototropha TaxID=3003348 RepID=A0A8T7M8Y6_9CHLR|nr:CYTH domain-containing protein [Chloroflexota bacterium]WJW68419.1 CYTH domain-containing protein [Chloroflexota bacterium L227-S17]
MLEIERKFLVKEELLPPLPLGHYLVQGYLSFGSPSVRVRLDTDGSGLKKAFLTIKGKGLVSREEFEYAILFEEAEQLLKLCQGAAIVKRRYIFPVAGEPNLKWELDVFEGENAGLVVVEVEIPHENYTFPLPNWIGQDVSEIAAYKNIALAQHPYKAWQ